MLLVLGKAIGISCGVASGLMLVVLFNHLIRRAWRITHPRNPGDLGAM